MQGLTFISHHHARGERSESEIQQKTLLYSILSQQGGNSLDPVCEQATQPQHRHNNSNKLPVIVIAYIYLFLLRCYHYICYDHVHTHSLSWPVIIIIIIRLTLSSTWWWIVGWTDSQSRHVCIRVYNLLAHVINLPITDWRYCVSVVKLGLVVFVEL